MKHGEIGCQSPEYSGTHAVHDDSCKKHCGWCDEQYRPMSTESACVKVSAVKRAVNVRDIYSHNKQEPNPGRDTGLSLKHSGQQENKESNQDRRKQDEDGILFRSEDPIAFDVYCAHVFGMFNDSCAALIPA